MTTRVDPAMYGDTPIFRDLLRERKGRWPGIPVDELPPVQITPTVMPLSQVPPPHPRRPSEQLVSDPEETVTMLIPHMVES